MSWVYASIPCSLVFSQGSHIQVVMFTHIPSCLLKITVNLWNLHIGLPGIAKFWCAYTQYDCSMHWVTLWCLHRFLFGRYFLDVVLAHVWMVCMEDRIVAVFTHNWLPCDYKLLASLETRNFIGWLEKGSPMIDELIKSCGPSIQWITTRLLKKTWKHAFCNKKVRWLCEVK